MPLAVIGAPDATPEAVLATGKTRIYIQANIHAGEVEGKEAMLWLLRSIAKGERAELVHRTSCCSSTRSTTPTATSA